MNQDTHQHFDIGQLARKYFDGTATEEEIAALHKWYKEADETDAAIVEATPLESRKYGRFHPERAEKETGNGNTLPLL